MKLYNKKNRLLLCCAVVLGGITAALSAFISLLLQKIIDVATQKDVNEFASLIPIMLVYLTVLAVMGFLESYFGKILIRNVTKHMRNDIFKGVITRDPSHYGSRNTADYLSALFNDVKLVEENYLVPLLLCSQMAALFLTTLGILLYLSPLVTAVLLVFLVLMFLIPALLGKKMQKRQDAYSDHLAKFTAKAKDFLNGYEIIRSYTMHPYILKEYAKINKETSGKKFSADKLLAVNECFSDLLSSLSVIVIVFVSSYLMLKGRITMGTLLALIQLSSAFVTPVVMLMQNLPKVTSMKPVLEHLAEFTKLPDIPVVQSVTRSPSFDQTLECCNVTFGYTPSQPVLKDLDLSVRRGGKYLLMGESGGGKSSLAKLLTGYSADFDGDIRYDGLSVKDIPQQQLNALASVIHQNIFLFDTTIYDNICLGEHFPQDQIDRVVAYSGIAQFLPDLEDGLMSMVGENGQNLSGGQRQRIAVARALIRNTPLLIIDEGTSAVDKETAYEIERKLLTKKDLTIITITHHMDDKLLEYYDEKWRLDNGSVSTASL